MGRRLSCLPHLPPLLQACLTEAIGTYFFVLVITLSIPYAGPLAPIAIGFALTTLVYSYGYVSKAQFNPAVSLGLFVSGIQNLKVTLIFMAVQCVMGFLAALCGSELMNSTDKFPLLAPYQATASLSDGHHVIRAFFVETIFTFNLAHTMINVAVSRQRGNHHFGLAIGMAVLCGAFAVGPISGASFNPAVTTGLHVVSAIRGVSHPPGSSPPIAFIWVYWIAELLGGCIAGIAFHLLDDEEEAPDSYQQIQNPTNEEDV